jgi:phosphotransferase system HPr (HPr) family protein
MTERTVVAGVAVHARPASQLAQTAAAFSSEITLERGDRRGNAKSVLSLLSLDVEAGDEVVVRADGEDADDAIAALEALLAGVDRNG